MSNGNFSVRGFPFLSDVPTSVTFAPLSVYLQILGCSTFPASMKRLRLTSMFHSSGTVQEVVYFDCETDSSVKNGIKDEGREFLILLGCISKQVFLEWGCFEWVDNGKVTLDLNLPSSFEIKIYKKKILEINSFKSSSAGRLSYRATKARPGKYPK